MRRCVIMGPLRAAQLHLGAWRLSAIAPPTLEVLLQGSSLDAATLAALADCRELTIEWREERVDLMLVSAQGRQGFSARSAILHQPLDTLYEALPLPPFDARARRFWRRVFWLVRMPGGKILLRLLARHRGQ